MELSKKEAKKIGDRLGVDWNQINLKEFVSGINVEFEHGTKFPETNITNDNKNLTGKIAWAHLKEFPDYYTRLKKMEIKANAHWKKTKDHETGH